MTSCIHERFTFANLRLRNLHVAWLGPSSKQLSFAHLCTEKAIRGALRWSENTLRADSASSCLSQELEYLQECAYMIDLNVF